MFYDEVDKMLFHDDVLKELLLQPALEDDDAILKFDDKFHWAKLAKVLLVFWFPLKVLDEVPHLIAATFYCLATPAKVEVVGALGEIVEELPLWL